jgi:HlyD family secretion protein
MRAWLGWVLGVAAAAAAAAGVLYTLRPPAPLRDPPQAGRSPAPLERVAALGRLEPRHGVRRIAGPPRAAVVIEELRIEEGDRVERGQIIAVLAGIGLQRAEVSRFEAELGNAARELERNLELSRTRVVAEAKLEAFELARDVAQANLERARADVALSLVRSPIAGRVLAIQAREGERVGAEGIVEIGETEEMYAVAEVYETDIGRVRPGQLAHVRSPALEPELVGEVARIGLKVEKNDVLSTDPVADADARVIEVDILLAEPERAASLTNLRVEVEIETGRAGGP